ncbi:MAG: histidine kinase [Bacteroidetes bacterium]|nr:histidine kinase [Bacteroidota bacterium]MCB0844390.1 histidine kinase [Bacteroidota bacterium]
MKDRLKWHIGFWLGYTLIYACLNTLFAGGTSDLKYEWPIRFLRFWANELVMLPLKLVATYIFLYWIVPRFLLQGNYLKGILVYLLQLIPILVVYRLVIYYVASPMLYGEYPAYDTLSLKRILYSFVDVGSAIGIASTFELLRGKLESHRREKELIKEKLQSELSFLRSQTNPHFLFNTLNNIYVLARKQSELTAPVVLKLSQILRFMLYECNKPYISIGDELTIIQDYLELEKLRYDDRLKVDYKEEVDDFSTSIAPLLLLPLVENAFKHGASESRFDAWIEIEIKLENHLLSLSAKNSCEETYLDDGSGIGLKNVKRQLELIYGENHTLNIQPGKGAFEVFLTIQLS